MSMFAASPRGSSSERRFVSDGRGRDSSPHPRETRDRVLGTVQLPWREVTGNGEPCDVCAAPIAQTTVEIECPLFKGAVVKFHVRCFMLWQTEREA